MLISKFCTAVVLGVGSLSMAALAQDPAPAAPAAKPAMTPAQMDRMFVKKAAEGGLMEVQLGTLAAQKATDPAVKSFGQKMVDDHTALNDSMKPIADKMGIVPPAKLNKKDQATYDMIAAKSGDDFDKAYVKDMVEDHRKDLHDFTKEMKTTTDPDLKAAVTHGRDVIQQHHEMIDKIASDKGIMTPAHHKAAMAAPAPGQ